MPKYISQGVTTVRDCGNEFDFINALQKKIEDKEIIGPQIIKAGLIDGVSKNALGIMQVNKKVDAINMVNKYNVSGFAQIKIYSNVKPRILKVICKEAHRLNMMVTGHIPIGITASSAIKIGLDIVSHISHLSNSLLMSNSDLKLSDKRTKQFIKTMQESKTVIDPTLSVFENADSYYVKNISNYKFLVNRLNQLGIPIIAGTDMNSGGIGAELNAYIDAGFSKLQAIRSATIIPAQIMKMDNYLGSIEIGKAGNMILIDGNPLDNIQNIKNVKVVVKGAQVYKY